jgi:hypothetical protein
MSGKGAKATAAKAADKDRGEKAGPHGGTQNSKIPIFQLSSPFCFGSLLINSFSFLREVEVSSKAQLSLFSFVLSYSEDNFFCGWNFWSLFCSLAVLKIAHIVVSFLFDIQLIRYCWHLAFFIYEFAT